jgi:hypothetical protein
MFSFQAASQPERLDFVMENEQSKKSEREPLAPLVLPQREPRLQPTPVRTVFHDESLRHSPTNPVSDIADGADFELMEVAITVYGLSGIICRTSDPKKRAKMFSKKGGTQISKASPRPSVHSFDFNESRNATVTKNSKDLNSANGSVPTTAIVSFRRNAFSSDTALETFMPSLPLTNPMSGFGNTVRYMASWPAGEGSALLETDLQGISTIKMTRVMKREKYRPETKIGQVSGYVHETIDLGVCLGRGKELVHLGTISFAITGDEEGEIVMNVPVKSLAKPHASAKRKSSKKKRSKISSFPHDSSRSYLLDDNATLRVGVRVLPQHTIKTAEDNADQQKIKKERSLEDILKGLFDENLILELDDEYDLLDGLVAYQNEKLDRERNTVETPQGIFPGFFCGALMCSAPPSSTKPVGVSKKGVVDKAAATSKKISEAVVLPLTLMSSVSESTDGSEKSRNAQFRRLLEL